MGRTNRQRKGHDLEYVGIQFKEKDLADLKAKQLFNDKWIIVKKLEKRGACFCYQVVDKRIKRFGVLYLEIGEDNVTTISNQVEFSLQQFSLGHSHRFTSVIDTGIINNHVFYMVVRTRSGPTLRDLLSCLDDKRMSAVTASFLAADLISIVELLTSTGYVLRNFNAAQWKLDVKTRTFYLADTTDIAVSSDKRHRYIAESHLKNADHLNLCWSSTDLTYAPCAFLENGSAHRMTELDMMEMILYILYDWTQGKLPWKSSKCKERTLEMKQEFLNTIPDVPEPHDHVELWFHISIRNLSEHLKVAKKAQERLEKFPVRGGAWCPKGPRAGALMSTVNYQQIIDDFQKIVCRGHPDWVVNWRDVKLDWDEEIEGSPENIEFFRLYEKRQKALEIAEDWERLMAIRSHCTVMKEHAETEQQKNQMVIDKYLMGLPDAELREIKEEVLDGLEDKNHWKQTQKTRREKRTKINPTDNEENVEEVTVRQVNEFMPDIKDEAVSSRAARAAHRAAHREILLKENELVPEKEEVEFLDVTMKNIKEEIDEQEDFDDDPVGKPMNFDEKMEPTDF